MEYEELARDSLKGGASLEGGLQTTAIYWENWQTPFRGLFGGLYGGKWSWRVVDDHIRHLLRLTPRVSETSSVVFSEVGTSERLWTRQFATESPDFYTLVPSKKSPNFTFFPCGTDRI